MPITQPIAAALLTGIITDTLGFRTSNTTPESLRQAATLMETGVDMPELYMRGAGPRNRSQPPVIGAQAFPAWRVKMESSGPR